MKAVVVFAILAAFVVTVPGLPRIKRQADVPPGESPLDTPYEVITVQMFIDTMRYMLYTLEHVKTLLKSPMESAAQVASVEDLKELYEEWTGMSSTIGEQFETILDNTYKLGESLFNGSAGFVEDVYCDGFKMALESGFEGYTSEAQAVQTILNDMVCFAGHFKKLRSMKDRLEKFKCVSTMTVNEAVDEVFYMLYNLHELRINVRHFINALIRAAEEQGQKRQVSNKKELVRLLKELVASQTQEPTVQSSSPEATAEGATTQESSDEDENSDFTVEMFLQTMEGLYDNLENAEDAVESLKAEVQAVLRGEETAESLSDDLETALRTLFQVIDGSAGTLGSMVHMAFVDPPLSIAGSDAGFKAIDLCDDFRNFDEEYDENDPGDYIKKTKSFFLADLACFTDFFKDEHTRFYLELFWAEAVSGMREQRAMELLMEFADGLQTLKSNGLSFYYSFEKAMGPVLGEDTEAASEEKREEVERDLAKLLQLLQKQQK